MPADLRAKDQLTHFKVDVTDVAEYGGECRSGRRGARGYGLGQVLRADG